MNEEQEKRIQELINRNGIDVQVQQRFYVVFIVLVIAFLFYYSARFYLNKYKNFKIPLLPERFYDNPGLNIIQAIIMMIGIFIGYVVVQIIF